MGMVEYLFADVLDGKIVNIVGNTTPKPFLYQHWLNECGYMGWSLVSVRLCPKFVYKLTISKDMSQSGTVWEYMYVHVTDNIVEVEGNQNNPSVLWETWLNLQGRDGWQLAGEMTKVRNRDFDAILKRIKTIN